MKDKPWPPKFYSQYKHMAKFYWSYREKEDDIEAMYMQGYWAYDHGPYPIKFQRVHLNADEGRTHER